MFNFLLGASIEHPGSRNSNSLITDSLKVPFGMELFRDRLDTSTSLPPSLKLPSPLKLRRGKQGRVWFSHLAKCPFFPYLLVIKELSSNSVCLTLGLFCIICWKFRTYSFVGSLGWKVPKFSAQIRNPNIEILNKFKIQMFKCSKRVFWRVSADTRSPTKTFEDKLCGSPHRSSDRLVNIIPYFWLNFKGDINKCPWLDTVFVMSISHSHKS